MKLWHRRDTVIKSHIYVSAFLTPMVMLVAISGGLYLLGIKGTISREQVPLSAGVSIDPNSASLEDDVRQMLSDLGIQHDFEYLKEDGTTL